MKELELPTIEELLQFYKKYIETADAKSLKDRARYLHDNCPSGELVHRTVLNACGALFAVGYPNVGSRLNPPSKEEAKKIIEALEKRKKELTIESQL